MSIDTFTPGQPYDPRNIEWAREHGYVHGIDTECRYSISDGIRSTNTRFLSTEGHMLLRRVPLGGRMVISGHGVGGEASDLFRIRPDIQITSIGRQAIDPWYRFATHLSAVPSVIDNYADAISYAVYNVLSQSSMYSLGSIAEMASTCPVLEPVDTPYIHMQYCARSIVDIPIEPGTIDCWYDNFGYAHYEKDTLAARHKILTSLSAIGVAFFSMDKNSNRRTAFRTC